MNHIEFVNFEGNNCLNSVEARVHLERLHVMTLQDAQKALSLYMKFLALKEYDLEILKNAY